MTRFGWFMFLATLLVIGGISMGAVYLHNKNLVPVTATTSATSTPLTDPSTLSIYTNGEFGFSFMYPATANIQDSFSATSSAKSAWRVGATSKGFSLVRVLMDTSEYRIGTATSTKEVATCIKVAPSEKVLTDTVVGSTTWKTFTFDQLGTDNEKRVTSYRTVYNKSCYVIEEIVPRAQVSSTTDRGSEVENIIMSFSFAGD